MRYVLGRKCDPELVLNADQTNTQGRVRIAMLFTLLFTRIAFNLIVPQTAEKFRENSLTR